MPGPVPLEEIEAQLRERLGLFAKAEPPPSPPPTLFQNFAREALTNPIINFMGPAGLGVSATSAGRMARAAPQSRPSPDYSHLSHLAEPLPQNPISQAGLLSRQYDRYDTIFNRREPVSEQHLVRDYPWSRIERLRNELQTMDSARRGPQQSTPDPAFPYGSPQNPFANMRPTQLRAYWETQGANLSEAERQALFRSYMSATGTTPAEAGRQLPGIVGPAGAPRAPHDARTNATPHGVISSRPGQLDPALQPPSASAPRLTTEDYNRARLHLPADASLAERTRVATKLALARAQGTNAQISAQQPSPAPLGAPALPPPTAESRLSEIRQSIGRMLNSNDPRVVERAQEFGQRLQEGRTGFSPRELAEINDPRLVQPAPAQPTPTPPAPGELGNFMDPLAPRPRGAAATAAALRARELDRTSPDLMTRLSTISEANRRQLPYEMDWSDIKVGNQRYGEHQWKIKLEPTVNGRKTYAGEIVGYANPRTKEFRISSSGIDDRYQGQGVGQEGYRRLFEKAKAEGYSITSDSTQSDYSFRLYRDVFPRMGYQAIRNPTYQHRGRGTYPHQSESGTGGNWTLIPKAPEALNLPPMSLADKMLLRGIEPSPFDPPLGVPRRIRRREE